MSSIQLEPGAAAARIGAKRPFIEFDVEVDGGEYAEAEVSPTKRASTQNMNCDGSSMTDWSISSIKYNDGDNNDGDNDNLEFQNRNSSPDDDYYIDEPACESDMTQLQMCILRAEDEQNDQALRDIAPQDKDIYNFNWTNDQKTFLSKREKFRGTSGPTFKVTKAMTMAQIFDKMIDVDFIDRLCRDTNQYATQQISLLREQNKLPPNSRFHRWVPTDRNEMLKFLTIQMLQGLYPRREEEDFGFGFSLFDTKKQSDISSVMSHTRFRLLTAFLHFVDDDSSQDRTQLRKVRPIVDYFNDRFASLYMPAQEICINESLLRWCGRLSFTRKISAKATQEDIKIFELCESSSGYLWRFSVYSDKDKPTTDAADTLDEPDRVADDTTTGNRNKATAKIVYELVEPLLHRGHTIIMDSFYNCPLLLRCLKRQKTDCFGTLRLNREFVPDLVKKLTKTDLRLGEVKTTYCSDLAIMVLWRDTNIISMISTYHNFQTGTTEKPEKHGILTYKPNIDVVLDYNVSMSGFNRKDQYLAAQPMERAWYKKLFRRIFNAAIFNCFIIYSTRHKEVDHRSFRVMLAKTLLKRHRQLDLTNEPRMIKKRKSPCETPQPYVEHNHFPIRTGSKSTVCGFCKRSRTIWKCEECNFNLCIEFCFKNYHKSPKT